MSMIYIFLMNLIIKCVNIPSGLNSLFNPKTRGIYYQHSHSVKQVINDWIIQASKKILIDIIEDFFYLTLLLLLPLSAFRSRHEESRQNPKSGLKLRRERATVTTPLRISYKVGSSHFTHLTVSSLLFLYHSASGCFTVFGLVASWVFRTLAPDVYRILVPGKTHWGEFQETAQPSGLCLVCIRAASQTSQVMSWHASAEGEGPTGTFITLKGVSDASMLV